MKKTLILGENMKAYNVLVLCQDKLGSFYTVYHVAAQNEEEIVPILFEQSKLESFELVEIDEIEVLSENTNYTVGIFQQFGRSYFEE